MPPGFRKDYAYQVVAGFFPNGSQRLHYMVINEGGLTIPLDSEMVIMQDPLASGYLGIEGTSGGQTCVPKPLEYTAENKFSTPSRIWTVSWENLAERYRAYEKTYGTVCDPTATFRRLVKGVTAFDLSWETMIPHRVQCDPEEEGVIVQWSYPVAGYLTLTLVPSYAQ